MKSEKQNVGFLRLIFSSFFRWWWAVLTGVASIAGWLFISWKPEEGILLSPLLFRVIILSGSVLVFLVLSIVYQSWSIYQDHYNPTRLRVVGYSGYRAYDCDHVFILEGNIRDARGTLIGLKRFYGSLEVIIALVEIMERNSKGQYQARSIWTAPGPLRDLRTGLFAYSEIIVEPLGRWEVIKRLKD